MNQLTKEMKEQGYTAVLNWWLDDLMPLISHDEWRILCRINRLIVGMNTIRIMQGKGSISQADLTGEYTGIHRPNNIVEALKNLVKWNVISILEKSKGGRNARGTKYGITMDKSSVNWQLIKAEHQARFNKNKGRFAHNRQETLNGSVKSESKELLTVALNGTKRTLNGSVKDKTLIYAFVEAQKAVFKEKAIYIIFNIDLLLNLIKEKNINLTTDLNVELMLSLINLIKEKNCENNQIDEWLGVTHIQESEDRSKQSNSTNLSIDSVNDFFDDLYSDELNENAVGLTAPVFAENSLPFVSAVINENEPEMKNTQAQLTFIDENELQRNSSDGQKEDREVGENDQLKEDEIVVKKPSRKKSIVNGAAQKNAENAVTDSKPRKPRKTSKYTQEQIEWRKMAYDALIDERGGAYIGQSALAAIFKRIDTSLLPLMSEGLTIADIHNVYRMIKFNDKSGYYNSRDISPNYLAEQWQVYVLNKRELPKGCKAWIDPTAVQVEPEKPKRKVLANSERYIE